MERRKPLELFQREIKCDIFSLEQKQGRKLIKTQVPSNFPSIRDDYNNLPTYLRNVLFGDDFFVVSKSGKLTNSRFPNAFKSQ